MNLIYDGAGLLSTSEAGYCMGMINDGYGYVVEMSKYPSSEWLHANLKQRDWWQTVDTPGGDQTVKRRSVLYGMVQKNFSEDRDERGYFIGGGFLFLKDVVDHQTVVKSFPELVIDQHPFKTRLG